MNDFSKFQAQEEMEALYEPDLGLSLILDDVLKAGATAGLPAEEAAGGSRTLKTLKNHAGIAGDAAEEKDARIDSKKSLKGKYDEEGIDEESYSAEFGISISGVYFDEGDRSLKVEYKLLPVDKALESTVAMAPGHAVPSPVNETEDAVTDAMAQGFYVSMVPIEKFAENALGSELKATYDSGVLNIEYKNVELINGQKTYQRIVLKAENDGESVYDLTVRKFSEAGLKLTAEYDGEFDSMLLTSINGRAEGVDGNFNEFYVNGEIGMDAVDRAKLKKNDTVEIRYAKETDGSCGGSPDFEAVKSTLEYSSMSAAMAMNPASPAMAGTGLFQPKPYHAPLGQMGQANPFLFQ